MFELLEVKWGEPVYGTPSGTINWSGDLAGDLPLYPGTDDADIAAAFEAALAAWENVAAVVFEYVETGADFVIQAGSLDDPDDPDDDNNVGAASFGPVLGSGLNSLSSGSITFSSDFLWSDYGSPGTDFYAVAAHEIGHILGLGHPVPEDPAQIMNAVISADDLGEGDIAGAQYIYGTDEGDVPVELPVMESSGGGGGGGALGLLAALLALIFGFGTGGAGVALAAGRLPWDGEGDGLPDGLGPEDLPWLPVEDLAHAGEGHDHAHGVTVAELFPLPMVEHDSQPKPCGCFGHCAHGETEAADWADGIWA